MPNIRVIPLNWWSERQAQVSEYNSVGLQILNATAGGDLRQVKIRATARW